MVALLGTIQLSSNNDDCFCIKSLRWSHIATSSFTALVTHCGLITPYCNIGLSQIGWGNCLFCANQCWLLINGFWGMYMTDFPENTWYQFVRWSENYNFQITAASPKCQWNSMSRPSTWKKATKHIYYFKINAVRGIVLKLKLYFYLSSCRIVMF